MKSKISFFNFGIFKTSIRRFWPIWAAYAAAWFLALPVMAMNSYAGAYTTENILCDIRSCTGGFGVTVAFISAIIIAAAVFSFMYNQKSNGMIFSLPVRREAVFCSAYLAGLIPFVVINILTALLTLLFASVGSANVSAVFHGLCIWLSEYTMAFVAFYGLAALVAMFTGNLITMIALYGIFSVLSVAVEALVNGVASLFIYGVTGNLDELDSFATLMLSPLLSMTAVENAEVTTPAGHLPCLVQSDITNIIIWFVVGIIFSALALLLYRRRRAESCGDVIAIPALRPVFKYGVAACAALSIGLMLFFIIVSSVWDSEKANFFIATLFTLFMIIGAFVGYFGSDMLLKKSFHVFKGNWGGFITLALICIAFVLCCDIDVLSIGGKAPEAGEVNYVELCGYKFSDKDDIENIIALQKDIYTEFNDHSSEGSDGSYINSTVFTYHLKNGKVFQRSYTYCFANEADSLSSPITQKLIDIINDPEAVYDRYALRFVPETENILYSYLSFETVSEYGMYGYETEDLSPEEAVSLYKNGILKDIECGNFRYEDIGSYSSSFDSVTDCNIEIDIGIPVSEADFDKYETVEEYGEGYFAEVGYMNYHINSHMENTLQWLKDNKGIDLYDMLKHAEA